MAFESEFFGDLDVLADQLGAYGCGAFGDGAVGGDEALGFLIVLPGFVEVAGGFGFVATFGGLQSVAVGGVFRIGGAGVGVWFLRRGCRGGDRECKIGE